MKDFYYYKLEKPKKNIFAEMYIHKIGFYRFNWHKYMELILIMKGNVEVCIEGERYNLGEEDLILINSNSGHATLAQEPGCRAMVLHIEPIYFEEYIKEYKYLKFNIDNLPDKNSESSKELRKLMINLLESLGKPGIENEIYAESCLGLILAKLIQTFEPVKIETDYHAKNQSHRETIYKILDYMEKNFIDPISLEEVAELIGYNPNYLSQYFKKNIGINFQDYLTRIRLREATIELSTTDLTIGEIAIKNGFSNIKSFNTSFKKAFNRVPSEYRKKIKEKTGYKERMTKRDFVVREDEIINRKIEEYKQKTEVNTTKENTVKTEVKSELELEKAKKLIAHSEARSEQMLKLLEENRGEIENLRKILENQN